MKDNKPKSKNKPAAALLAAMLAIGTPFVATQEGLSVVPYRDIGGVWTWCYGETEGVVPKKTFTNSECSALLRVKLLAYGMSVWWLIDTKMTAPRWAALTSFSYNVGINAFSNSTLRRKINANDPKACDELNRWTYIGKRDCKIPTNGCMGLPNRRNEERKLCNS
ncbi:lysozyme [Dyadobacter sp. CY323]|uniref:lysozyme n=1 Tax=Dyadobacter sp. CY323 TaxID=2907302 RepID=UPI001F405EBA|nr:lysozyme [Dyadobacter sp. CY323]MCE6993129.1 lysozyme [Dyadobacter sp. CY323]